MIKRYANRKLYDTTERRFTSLSAIQELVANGVDVVVQDHNTGIDRTEMVLSKALTQALAEQVRQTEALTGALAKQVQPTDRGRPGSSVRAQLTRMPAWVASSAEAKNPNTAEELRRLRSEVEELARQIDVLLLEAGP